MLTYIYGHLVLLTTLSYLTSLCFNKVLERWLSLVPFSLCLVAFHNRSWKTGWRAKKACWCRRSIFFLYRNNWLKSFYNMFHVNILNQSLSKGLTTWNDWVWIIDCNDWARVYLTIFRPMMNCGADSKFCTYTDRSNHR